MDFISGLPKFGHANNILVSLDKFTKYNHFLPIHHPYIEIPIAQLFIDHIYKLHGLPLAISSDRDLVLIDKLVLEVFAPDGVWEPICIPLPKRMDKFNKSTNVWELIFNVSFMPALLDGSGGFFLQSTGTIPAAILSWEPHHSRSSMATSPFTLDYLSQK
jgi:hypothetical protein